MCGVSEAQIVQPSYVTCVASKQAGGKEGGEWAVAAWLLLLCCLAAAAVLLWLLLCFTYAAVRMPGHRLSRSHDDVDRPIAPGVLRVGDRHVIKV